MALVSASYGSSDSEDDDSNVGRDAVASSSSSAVAAAGNGAASPTPQPQTEVGAGLGLFASLPQPAKLVLKDKSLKRKKKKKKKKTSKRQKTEEKPKPAAASNTPPQPQPVGLPSAVNIGFRIGVNAAPVEKPPSPEPQPSVAPHPQPKTAPSAVEKEEEEEERTEVLLPGEEDDDDEITEPVFSGTATVALQPGYRRNLSRRQLQHQQISAAASDRSIPEHLVKAGSTLPDFFRGVDSSAVQVRDVNQSKMLEKSHYEQLLEDLEAKHKRENPEAQAVEAARMPSRLQKRKHQINQVAHFAAAIEADMAKNRIRTAKTRRETQAKYGW